MHNTLIWSLRAGFDTAVLYKHDKRRNEKMYIRDIFETVCFIWGDMILLQKSDIIAEIWITNTIVPHQITCLYQAATTWCYQNSS